MGVGGLREQLRHMFLWHPLIPTSACYTGQAGVQWLQRDLHSQFDYEGLQDLEGSVCVVRIHVCHSGNRDLQEQQQHHHYATWFGELGRLGWALVATMTMMGYSRVCHSNKPAWWQGRWIGCGSSRATNLADFSIQVVACALHHLCMNGVRSMAARGMNSRLWMRTGKIHTAIPSRPAVFSSMSGTRSPPKSGMDNLLVVGGGDMARSDELWSNSGRGDSEKVGDSRIDDEPGWACMVNGCWRRIDDVDATDDLADGVDDCVDELDAVRCQSCLSPEGFVRRVGRTSLRLLYVFVHFKALWRIRVRWIGWYKDVYRESEWPPFAARFRRKKAWSSVWSSELTSVSALGSSSSMSTGGLSPFKN